MSRKLTILVIVLLIFLGAVLASDPRFVPPSRLIRNPLLFAYLYAPTIFFAVIAWIKFKSGRVWVAAAFAVGLLCTGLFHQYVAADTYGNPGYMFPAAHMVAPVVSLAAYLVALLGGWIVVRTMQKVRRVISQDGQGENSNDTQDV